MWVCHSECTRSNVSDDFLFMAILFVRSRNVCVEPKCIQVCQVHDDSATLWKVAVLCFWFFLKATDIQLSFALVSSL